MFEFAKEMFFYENALRNKCLREKALIKLIKSPAIMAEYLKE